jgi:hypothetical protein
MQILLAQATQKEMIEEKLVQLGEFRTSESGAPALEKSNTVVCE